MSDPTPPITDAPQPDAPPARAVPENPLSPTPRALTPRVLSQSWRDPRVRFWWLMAILMAALAVTLSITGIQRWTTESRIARDGLLIKARVFESGGHIGNTLIAVDALVDVEYDLGGKRYKETGRLPFQDKPLRNGTLISIRVDPKDPTQWTALTEPPSLAREMIGPILLAPACALAILISMLLRRRLLMLWKQGQCEPAIVVDSKQTAIAPMSWHIRCTRHGRQERSIVAVYIPQRFPRPAPGQVIWLITMPTNSDHAIAAKVYQ